MADGTRVTTANLGHEGLDGKWVLPRDYDAGSDDWLVREGGDGEVAAAPVAFRTGRELGGFAVGEGLARRADHRVYGQIADEFTGGVIGFPEYVGRVVAMLESSAAARGPKGRTGRVRVTGPHPEGPHDGDLSPSTLRHYRVVVEGTGVELPCRSIAFGVNGGSFATLVLDLVDVSMDVSGISRFTNLADLPRYGVVEGLFPGCPGGAAAVRPILSPPGEVLVLADELRGATPLESSCMGEWTVSPGDRVPLYRWGDEVRFGPPEPGPDWAP